MDERVEALLRDVLKISGTPNEVVDKVLMLLPNYEELFRHNEMEKHLKDKAAQKGLERHGISVDLVEGSAEEIPLENASVDTVVTTWTLCTIPDVDGAPRQMRRVLRPSGRLLFVEHGRAPDPNVMWWQDRLTPIWKTIGGGCHLNRPISSLIEGAGFRIERLQVTCPARSR